MGLVLVLSFAGTAPAQDDGDGTQDAIDLFNKGQEAHEKGDLNGAIKLYDQALEIIPEFPEAELQKGSALLAVGKTADAEKSFRRATELRENWTLAMASLGGVLVRKGEYAEAEKILNKAIELDDMNFPAYAAMTELRLKTKARPELLKTLLDRLKILSSKANPTVSVLTSRGSLENALGDKGAAKKSLDQALSMDPKNRTALFERAEVALAESDLTHANEIIKILSTIVPGSDDLALLKARAAVEGGQSDEALKILDSIKDPSADVTSLRERIVAAGSENASELEAQLAKNENNAIVLGRLCSVLRVPDPVKAIGYCKRAFDLEPKNLSHATGYGAALVQAKQYEPAVNLFRSILKFTPDNFTVHSNLAAALFQLKRYEEAKTEYQWLVEKQPDLVIAYYLLGITHDQLTEYMDAAANYQIFLKRADTEVNKLEIDKVNLRMPAVQKLIKEKKGKK